MHTVKYLIAGCSNAEQGNVRIVNGSTPFEGRIEICNNRRWGTVCDDAWGTIDANIACRQLGFSGTGEYTAAYTLFRSCFPIEEPAYTLLSPALTHVYNIA